MAHAQTKIIAHRGFSGIAPENTIIAFQKAIECGADFIELDVHKTKDDSIVVIHDATVDRTSSNGMKGSIAEMTFRDLSGVKAGYSDRFGNEFESEKIPTLREVLELARGKIKVCVEIKVDGAEKEVLDIVNDLQSRDEVIIFSFKYDVLEKIRQMDKEIHLLYLETVAGKSTLESATLIDAFAIGVGPLTKVNKSFLKKAHDKGIEVWVWTINEEKKMKRFINIGIDGLITNYPDKALNIISTESISPNK
jgi:glycerophosphoryl diester phosphodiesterase